LDHKANGARKILEIKNHNEISVNNITYKVDSLDCDINLLDWIRDNTPFKGTKEGCNEGDCGACSVLVYDKNDKFPKPINSCLVRLGQLYKKNVITVEGLGSSKKLNPVQKSFVKNHASQCGYCTPGFVVAGTSIFYENEKIDYETIHDALSGNLCRCTGYVPIIRALMDVKNFVPPKLIYNDVITSPKIKIGNSTYFHPKNLKELKNILFNLDHFQFIAGGTDLNLEREIYDLKESNLVCLENVNELKKVSIDKNKIILGSCVSLEEFLKIAKNKIPQIIEIIKRFGSPLIRNQATIGGNICTSSPIGDIAPILLTLSSEIITFSKKGHRKIPIEKFFKSYRKNILYKDEIIEKIIIHLPKKNQKLLSWKFSKRYDQDISTLSVCILYVLENNIIKEFQIAAGGIAEKPVLLKNISRQIIGKSIDTSFETLIADIKQYINPISDLRGSSEYRINTFKGVFLKLKNHLINKVNLQSIMD